MKKNIFKLLLGIALCFTVIRPQALTAAENINVTGINNNIDGLTLENKSYVLKGTETSVVYDMAMKPAKKYNLEKNLYDNPKNPYKTTKSPAQITKQGKFYFLADTFHNQVIYTSRLDEPISNWRVMSSKVEGPHSVASDGNYYLVADTENDRVLIFEWIQGGFRFTGEFEKMGVRPHYIEYDEASDSFYVWSSMTCEMYILTKDVAGDLCIKEIRGIKELQGHYIRSFTISGEYIIFPSGTNKQILITDKNTLEILGRFLVPDEISGMAYIKPMGNYFYMTVSSDDKFDQSKATVIRSNDLSQIINGGYEDISAQFPHIKIPYYIDHIDGMYYMTNHGSNRNVMRFYLLNDKVKFVKAMEF